MKFITKIILLVLFLGATLFAKDVATVTGLNGQATLERGGKSIGLSLGDKLQEKDTILTKEKAKVQIIFEDETIVTIGKNSNFSIHEYLFEDNQTPSVKFGMLAGAMQTITGKIAKIAPDKFSVKTKTATIGIRGTNFTIADGVDGAQNVYCTYGAISVTFQGAEHIVRQGFYVEISLDGRVKLREFTPAQLKKVKKSNFVKGRKGKGKSGGIAGNAGQLDTTKGFLESEIVVKDISESTQDATQTSDSPDDGTDGSDGNDGVVEESGAEAYPINMTGFATKNLAPDGTPFGDLNFDVLSKQTFGNHGKMGIVLEPGEPTNPDDSWLLNISPTPVWYISKESFKTTFSSVTIVSGDSTNPTIVDSYLEATNDDLSGNDYMSWGKWAATIEYDYDDDGTPSHGTHYAEALWVAGEQTEVSVVDSRNDNHVEFEGVYRAIDFSHGEVVKNGYADMEVNFGSDTATLQIYENEASSSSVIGNFGMAISGNTLSGNQVGGSGEATGQFYGPDANSVGGAFTIDPGSGATHKGVYEVTHTPQPAPSPHPY